jgi:hypothetical protein
LGVGKASASAGNDIQAPSGAVMQMPGVEHLAENRSDGVLEVIQVELK